MNHDSQLVPAYGAWASTEDGLGGLLAAAGVTLANRANLGTDIETVGIDMAIEDTLMNLKYVVGTARSRTGCPEPEVVVRVDVPFSRPIFAALYRLAAEIELATPMGAHWLVQVSLHEGRVYLELADATPEEAARGHAVLVDCVRRVRKGKT